MNWDDALGKRPLRHIRSPNECHLTQQLHINTNLSGFGVCSKLLFLIQ
jgi:hypothetical protein